MTYRITVLTENEAPAGSGLEAEHGLSLFVEIPETKFLFDCGQTGIAGRNAARLGVKLSDVRFVVLSHSHYDHAGGFPFLPAECRPEALYIGPGFWREKYSLDAETGGYLYKGCGFSSEDLKARGIAERVCENLLPLDGCASLFTGFPQKHPRERIPEKFRRGDRKEPDPFEDEICLLLKEEDGLALVVGCSHRGILNIAAAVRARTGLPVRRVIGGIHLSGEPKERIEETLAELEGLGVRTLNLCHCSGAEVPGRVSAGSVIEVP